MAKISILFVLLSHLSATIATVLIRDCYKGSPPFCNNSLASDPTCRGLEVTTADGWKRMDCDYVLYNIPSPTRTTNKWLVIHAGGCDTYTENLGDFFAPDMGLNIFGLRPCGGFDDSECYAASGYDICTALHISWYFPALNPESAPYGLGLNPPALVDIYHTPGTTMLFLHEYGKTNASYNWYPASGCNDADKPIYMCVAGLDPSYSSKFSAVKSILEPVSNTDEFPCKLEVIDAVPYAQDQDPGIPCTGVLREYNDPERTDMRHGGDYNEGAPNWAWEMPDWMNRAVMLATETDPGGVLVQAFEEAIDVALCKDWSSEVGKCLDDDDIVAQ